MDDGNNNVFQANNKECQCVITRLGLCVRKRMVNVFSQGTD